MSRVLKSWTPQEHIDLEIIKRQSRDVAPDKVYDFLVMCMKWASSRVVIYAAMHVANKALLQEVEESIES